MSGPRSRQNIPDAAPGHFSLYFDVAKPTSGLSTLLRGRLIRDGFRHPLARASEAIFVCASRGQCRLLRASQHGKRLLRPWSHPRPPPPDHGETRTPYRHAIMAIFYENFLRFLTCHSLDMGGVTGSITIVPNTLCLCFVTNISSDRTSRQPTVADTNAGRLRAGCLCDRVRRTAARRAAQRCPAGRAVAPGSVASPAGRARARCGRARGRRPARARSCRACRPR